MGGAGSVDYADLAPLAGRGVGIWGDNDDAGETAAGRLAARLYFEQRCRVTLVVPPEGKPKGWDLADAVDEGWTSDQAVEHAMQYRVSVQFRVTIDETKIEVVTAEQMAARKAANAQAGQHHIPTPQQPERWGKIEPRDDRPEPPPAEKPPEHGVPFTEGELSLAFT